MKEYVCCLCGGFFVGWGNNPEPLDHAPNRCCDRCNEKVIRARIVALSDKRAKEDA